MTSFRDQTDASGAEGHRAGGGIVRQRIRCVGQVQGVGFRPAVYAVAMRLGLGGWVRNDRAGVLLEIEGSEGDVAAFPEALRQALPPLARLESLEVTHARPVDVREGTAGAACSDGAVRAACSDGVGNAARGFRVLSSELEGAAVSLPPPDAAVCEACLAELRAPGDRRGGYPFTVCSHCGPRFSVVRGLPYDRARTSMAEFALCDDCRREYEDPADRRFHAEPVCCPACGPRLRWWAAEQGRGEAVAGDETAEEDETVEGDETVERGGTAVGEAALAAARRVLGGGGIVALKGLGGFQLACRADDREAVARLRRRKARPAQPFAVMVRDRETARRLVALGPEDEAWLGFPRGAILLAPARREGGPAAEAEALAPGLGDLGVMLPTTPLHHRLFEGAPYDRLVMTSGNRSGEPLCVTDVEAAQALGAVADGFLSHDREVVRRVDDSVARSGPPGTGPYLVRRARGWVPQGLPLPSPSPSPSPSPIDAEMGRNERDAAPVLAVGGHLQVTAAVAVEGRVVLTQHVGDLETEAARRALREAVAGLEALLGVAPAVVAVDAHPDYPSAAWGRALAAQRGGRVVAVQHHHAHAAAVLAEHGRYPTYPTPGSAERVAALVLDGTGYGADGTAWGGELLLIGGGAAEGGQTSGVASGVKPGVNSSVASDVTSGVISDVTSDVTVQVPGRTEISRNSKVARFPAAARSAMIGGEPRKTALFRGEGGWDIPPECFPSDVTRLAHLEPLPLVGGERAVRQPWRVALGALATTAVAPLLESTPMAQRLEPAWIRAVYDLARAGVGAPATGAGRLFEAAGALLGLAVENTWEGEAAARLEALAERGGPGESWPEVLERVARGSAPDPGPAPEAEPESAPAPAPAPGSAPALGSAPEPAPVPTVLPSRALLMALVRRLVAGEAPAALAAGFFETFCALAGRLVEQHLPSDVERVALGGGCLVNRRLRRGLAEHIRAAGREPLLPRRVPAGDGGLSYGQAVVAVVSGCRGSASAGAGP